jgi:hypothetical protein
MSEVAEMAAVFRKFLLEDSVFIFARVVKVIIYEVVNDNYYLSCPMQACKNPDSAISNARTARKLNPKQDNDVHPIDIIRY